jgi:GcrA cell cycle regulator
MGVDSTNGWTDDRVEVLKRLWSEGLSASQIAKQLGGVTRNAVIGKVHRLGLAGRAAPSRPAARMVAVPRTKPAVVPRPAVVAGTDVAAAQLRAAALAPAPQAAQSAQGSQGATAPAARRAAPRPDNLIGVLELTSHTCRWPIGDPDDPEFGFCGMKTAEGLPYCPEHAAIAYQQQVDRKPGEPKREDRAQAEVRRLARLANY